jgi:beta-glucosidase
MVPTVTFAWGTTQSARHARGAAPASDLALWEKERRLPSSGQGNGFETSYADDFALWSAHGLTHHRLELDWARIQPSAGRIDAVEVDHLMRVLEAADDAGVAIWATLVHDTVPGWFLDEGGFRDEKTAAKWWPRHVAWCGETFGARVAGWVPLHEPIAMASDAYLNGVRPPGKTSAEDFSHTLRNLVVAWRDAWRELRGGGPLVATAWNLHPIYALEPTPACRRAADAVDEIIWGVWRQALADGVAAVPGLGELELPDLAGSADLIGVTYSHAIAVDAEMGFHPYPPEEPLWTEGLAHVLHRVAEELPDTTLLVASHRTPTTDDDVRVAAMRDAVPLLTEAQRDGIPMHGWFHEPAIDGPDAPTGLFTRERTPKDSALVLAELR